MRKKFIMTILIVAIFSMMSISNCLYVFAEEEKETETDVNNLVNELSENIDEDPTKDLGEIEAEDEKESTSESVENDIKTDNDKNENNEDENKTKSDENLETTEELKETENTEKTTDESDKGSVEEVEEVDEEIDEEVDESTEKEIESQIEDIITAFAKHYKMDREEAAYEIELLMELTDEQGGIYYISEDGTLVFEYSVTFEIRSDGTMLINGENIGSEVAQNYGLSEDEFNEFMLALLDELGEDENFTIEYKDDDRIVFSYTSTIEIDKNGVMYIDDEEVPVEDVEDIVAEKGKEANPIKVVVEEKSALPKTGEDSSNYFIYIGLVLVLVGVGYAFYKKRFSAKN